MLMSLYLNNHMWLVSGYHNGKHNITTPLNPVVFATSQKGRAYGGGPQRRIKMGWSVFSLPLCLRKLGTCGWAGRNDEKPWDFFRFFIKALGGLVFPLPGDICFSTLAER